jgi:hypothetical protein
MEFWEPFSVWLGGIRLVLVLQSIVLWLLQLLNLRNLLKNTSQLGGKISPQSL